VLHVGPAIRHPLEFVIAFEEIEIADTAGVSALCGAQRRSHDRKQNLDAVRLKRTRQFERIGPNTTDGVGSHEYPCEFLLHKDFSRKGAKPQRKTQVPSLRLCAFA
jgi:hypothetical protein